MVESNPLQGRPAENEKEEKSTALTAGTETAPAVEAQPQEGSTQEQPEDAGLSSVAEAARAAEALAGGTDPESQGEGTDPENQSEDDSQQPQEVPEVPKGRADRSLMYFFWPLVVTLLYVPVGLIWLAYRFLEYKTQLLLLTNKRLVLFKGIIKKKQYMIPLDMAAQMTIEQGFLGRKAGYGTLVIGQGKEAIRYNYVRDPEKFRLLCRTEA